MKKEKIQKQNVMFVSHLAKDSAFVYSFYKYTKKRYNKFYNCFDERINAFFLTEALFSFVVRLQKDVLDEVANYNYKAFLLKNKNRFYVKHFFRWLAKVYFVKYYGKLYKNKINYLFIYDDNEIKKKALILAAKVLKINYVIIYEGYKKNNFLLDRNATRWHSLMPVNEDFYLNLNCERITTQSQKTNFFLVLLQDEKSVECVLNAPVISKKSELMKLIINAAAEFLNYKFVIFNSNKNAEENENVVYTKENFESYLPYAKAVITINSMQALQALDFEIPIITFGDAFYNIKGVSVSPKTPTEFLQVLKNPQIYYNKEVAGGFMNYLDENSIEISSMENPSNNVMEKILNF